MFLIILAAFTALFGTSGVSPAPNPTPAPGPVGAPVEVDESDNGDTVRLRSGQRLIVEVEENQTTPYSWSVSYPPAPRILNTDEDDYTTDPECPDGASGCGGTHRYEYTAGAPGTTKLVLVEGRGGDEPASTTLRLTIVVSG